jgi:hypothetical protein
VPLAAAVFGFLTAVQLRHTREFHYAGAIVVIVNAVTIVVTIVTIVVVVVV